MACEKQLPTISALKIETDAVDEGFWRNSPAHRLFHLLSHSKMHTNVIMHSPKPFVAHFRKKKETDEVDEGSWSFIFYRNYSILSE